MKPTELEIQAKFWQLVKIPKHSSNDECWLWIGGKLNNGYGVASIGAGKTELAHRAVARWQGLDMSGVIRHVCDNPSCVRPGHMVAGSQSDNMIDMMSRNRRKNVFTIEQVKDIRSKTLTRAEYAKKYKVSEYTIGDCQRRNTYKWVI
jgi:hypothetical protein